MDRELLSIFGRACQGRGLLRAAEGVVRQAHLPLCQDRRGAARAVLVSLLEDGQEDEKQVCGKKIGLRRARETAKVEDE